MFAIHLCDLNDGHIEGTSTEVVHCNLGIAALLIQSISQGSSRRLVDNPLYLKPGDFTRVFGRLALGVIEISRDSNHRLRNIFAQVFLGGFLHFLERFSRHLRRRELLVFNLYPGITITGPNDRIWHHLYVFLHHVIREFAPN